MEEKIIHTTYGIIRRVLRPFMKGLWVKKVSGLNNIPKKGAAIVVLNHQSYFDFLTFGAISPRNIHFLSAEKFFEDNWWNPIMKLTGQIRVNRHSSDKNSLHKLVYDHLRKGKIIGIFPEGTRSPHRHAMLQGFNGAARYALEHKVPIIPIGIRGAYDVMSRHMKYPTFNKQIEIHVGKPIKFDINHDQKMDEKEYGLLTHKLMKELEILSGKDYPYEPSQKEPRIQEGLIILDMDGTLLRGQSQEYLVKYLKKEGIISKYTLAVILGWFALYKLHLTKNTYKITEYALSSLAGLEYNKFDGIVESFFNNNLKKHIYHDSKGLVESLRKQGKKIILVSAAINPIVERFAKEIGIEDYICTQIQVKDGLFTGKIEGVPIYGEEKISAVCGYKVRNQISFEKSEVYTDSISDLTLLRLVGKPVAVNPDNKLKAVAQNEKWQIIHLR